MIQTPQALRRNSLTDWTSSPLASIQTSRQRLARHSWANSPYSGSRNGETPAQLARYSLSFYQSQRGSAAQSPTLHTPENGVRRVFRGAEEDFSSFGVRRCLFPHSPSITAPPPPLSQSRCTGHSCLITASPHEERQLPGIDCNLSIKKSASKRRLKRL